MQISEELIKKVAKLANLDINDSEIEKYCEQLSKTLDYIELLEKVDTSRVDPTFNITDNFNVMSADTAIESLTPEEALKNGKSRNGCFITKGVFDNE